MKGRTPAPRPPQAAVAYQAGAAANASARATGAPVDQLLGGAAKTKDSFVSTGQAPARQKPQTYANAAPPQAGYRPRVRAQSHGATLRRNRCGRAPAKRRDEQWPQ